MNINAIMEHRSNEEDGGMRKGVGVRLKSTGVYVGKVEDVRNVKLITIRLEDGAGVVTLADNLEVAPRLTPEQAWEELPYTILRMFNRIAAQAIRPDDYDLRQIRHQCYKLLGGAGIKVDEQVKERVRKAIVRLADAMGVDLG